MGADHEHRLCTYAEAEAAIRKHDRVFVNDCFCRTPASQGKEKRPYCGHALRTCMGFRRAVDMHVEIEEMDQARALRMLEDWKKRGFIFRFMMDEEWLCFCCPCGCGWFFTAEGQRQADPCKPSPFIQRTDLASCTLCGLCVKVCAYGARRIEDDRMLVESAKCSGCSACEYVCQPKAIAMVKRDQGVA